MNFDNYVDSSIKNLESLKNQRFQEVFQSAAELLLRTISNNGAILVCGNGGSHSDAQHFAGELVNYFTIPHKALRVITLGTNSTVASAWSNDHSYEEQFAREVSAYGNDHSLLIGITTSGKSKNVNKAFEKAMELGMRTLALSSTKAVSKLPLNLDVILDVPSDETHKIQELHIVIYHALCIYVEENLPKDFLI
jgi:D-sedoheptulose 7-phosphate isomerase